VQEAKKEYAKCGTEPIAALAAASSLSLAGPTSAISAQY
jgi:hypothetical protein